MLEKRIREEISDIKNVIIHIEPYKEVQIDVREAIKKILQLNPSLAQNMKMKSLVTSKIQDKVYLDLVCDFSKSMTVEEVHKITASFESLLRELLGDDVIVTIHQEPA